MEAYGLRSIFRQRSMPLPRAFRRVNIHGPHATRFPHVSYTRPFGGWVSGSLLGGSRNDSLVIGPSHVRRRSTKARFAREKHLSSVNPSSNLAKAEQALQNVLANPNPSPEEEILDVLRNVELCVLDLLERENAKQPQQSKPESERDACSTTAMLDLDKPQANGLAHSPPTTNLPISMPSDSEDGKEQQILSDISYRLLVAPPVFITESILEQYVEVQSLLSRPMSFPEAFALYRYKPSPPAQGVAGKNDFNKKIGRPVKSSISSAVPESIANTALNTGLRVRSLPLVLSIIENSYATSSFRWNKFLRRALPPAAAACFTPFAAYTLALRLAEHQTGLSTESFTQIAFSGIFTYAACVGTIGWVALATANDQMQRVTWVDGTPLWERWVREEERAALDRVACAWGLREKWRWGEEEGEEWDSLREWIGLNGMVLDKVSLMEGMQ